jgi:phage tail protein X
MSQLYRSRENDMVDALCYHFYNRQAKAVELVYAANRGLAEYGPVLPAGILITLPEIPDTETAATIKLWN